MHWFIAVSVFDAYRFYNLTQTAMNRLFTWTLTGILLLATSLISYSNHQAATAVVSLQGSTLMENIISSKQRPLLTQLLTQAGLVPTLSGSGPFTLFAPSEEALRKIQSENPERLREILSNHIVQGTFTCADLKEGVPMPTLSGKTITIMRKKDRVLVNGVEVTHKDNSANNGVMHQVADVIMP